MKTKLAIAIIAAAGYLCTPLMHAELVINELMQSNIDCLKDDLNEFPDSWVELYNDGNSTVKLEEYSLGVSNDYASAYQLPSLDMNPGQFIVIYCDKVNDGLHTDFRLDSGKGGSVYLFHKEAVVSGVENWKKQPAPNIAYGRESEDSDNWGYQAVPTPGNPNCKVLCKDILSEPIFNVEGKVFSKPFSLTLRMPDDAPEQTEIRYTLDGSEPTESSLMYTDPINIDQTTVVRAKLVNKDFLSPRSTTHSFIIHPRELTLPLISIVSDDRYFYDEKEGILIAGTYNEETPNYQYDWRRPINIEYFEDVDTSSKINQLCETRVKGGSTRKLPLKSLAVYANKRFGTKRFNYEFFPDQTPGIEDFKSFELRNSGDDYNTTYMRDAIIQKSMGMNCDIDWQPSQPAIVYINGIYKGILNIRPRSNEDHIYSYYDGLEDIDMIENWHELKEGSIDSFNDFKKFYFEEGHTFAEYDRIMDIEEFCNLMIMNIFYDNKDFPGNNIVMWRPSEEGGRWRWIAKDTDFGLGLYGEPFDYPTLQWITTPGFDDGHNSWANGNSSTMLFRRLLETEEFKNMFIDRSAIYLGDFLQASKISNLIDGRHDELSFEFQYHRENLGQSNRLSENVEVAKEWITNRVPAFYSQISSFFSLIQPIPLTVSVEAESDVHLIVNGIELQDTEFNGKFFPGRNLHIEVASEAGSITSSNWIIDVKNIEGTSSMEYESSTLMMEMPYGEEVNITLIPGDINRVETITYGINMNLPYETYDIAGRLVSTQGLSSIDLPSGIYIIRQGKKTKKITVK